MPTFFGRQGRTAVSYQKGPQAIRTFGPQSVRVADQDFAISGITRTGAGAALGNCEVELFNTETDTIENRLNSDVDGAYRCFVTPAVSKYAVAYLAGAPDRAGTTKNTIVGGDVVSIYLRDPTVADSAGAAVFRPVGSAVVRRIGR